MEEITLGEKIALLTKVGVFSKLKNEEIAVVATYSRMMDVPRGTAVFTENSYGRQLFVVKEGEVLITKHREREHDIDLAQYLPGESFGEMDLVANMRRGANAVAIRDTRLLVFPAKGITFEEVLTKYPRISAQILSKMLATVAGRVRRTHELIREREPWIQNLKKQLFVDTLTGLLNANFLREDLPGQLPFFEEPVSLILVKPDNFKKFNDAYGHEAGDRALMLVAVILQSVERESYIAARYRGDEFVLVLPGTGREEAIDVARDLGRSLYEVDFRDITCGAPFKLALSAGIALYPQHARDGRALLEIAYEKMLGARNKGGNRIAAAG
ncbi:MAG TPA: GGDEF domain-containing protein [Spirochaetota bacterium]|nr:GGDEF domain-containing protein [Spirochaetota bacterium]HNT12684.1 GGDEF domain-containing protein [Spirochaetota bacterium]HNV47021.1 GGDEF domain-containing protein [Spirochaetota bacterium]HOS41679.1 GGDEF domain-containing protein [Spirochaetota bacterium]HPU87318.1 GGDEF domain-containing protein [Spirochaetota bacterium]